MDHINLFQTNAEFNAAYNGSDYVEPWVSFSIETSGIAYNKREEPHDYSQDYLTFVMLTSGSIETSYDEIELSIDGGENWETGGPINVSEGDKILVRGSYTCTQGCTCPFSIDGNFNVEGNLLSIYDAVGFRTRTSLNSSEDQLNGIFFQLYGLISAENLILPLTALTPSCYNYMFGYCDSLVKAPILPATTLSELCYKQMFTYCTSLTTAPELPATTLGDYCYDMMFDGCTSLTTAPTLPATTLSDGCYNYMFRECSSLITAPELPAVTLAEFCYNGMFSGCTSLNYIKCLAIVDPEQLYNYTDYWVDGVASTGTFVKNSSMTWPESENGVPWGWTVQDA